MEAAYVAMEAAEDALKRLRRFRRNPITKWMYPRRQFRYALMCIVFSALAVEASLKKFMASRIGSQSRLPERAVLKAMWSEGTDIPRLLKFVAAASLIDRQLLADIGRLFQYRNKLIHATAIVEESEEQHDVKGTIQSRTIKTHMMSKEDVERTEWCLDVSARAQAALGAAFREPGWKFER